MEAIVPYLMFNGNASEALAFYAKIFDGKVLHQQSYGDIPGDAPPDAQKDKIMHASFAAGKLVFMVSDASPQQKVSAGSNTQLVLNFESVNSIEKTFAALAEDGAVTMPLQDTFWGATFGMITDKFGISWMLNHELKR